ncbi:hypothetical protein GCWU000325_02427 [Alloprevotella tannerae ATCC 51259]|uniref:Uncharacterized protein n=1 Tax=Alloprevotella tannerae ATCC 51259 TaxID=626522 RepID=C9LJL4_9BACT|nr:hypothetical protein GCWU000325_02427 [Alloprevotella tannerae ATCC 51259]
MNNGPRSLVCRSTCRLFNSHFLPFSFFLAHQIIVCSGQTMVCCHQTIVCSHQTMVCSGQTKRASSIGRQ